MCDLTVEELDRWIKQLDETPGVLPNDWMKGLDCPECHTGAERPKCFYELGGSCPRRDPDSYDPAVINPLRVPNLFAKRKAAFLRAAKEKIMP